MLASQAPTFSVLLYRSRTRSDKTRKTFATHHPTHLLPPVDLPFAEVSQTLLLSFTLLLPPRITLAQRVGFPNWCVPTPDGEQADSQNLSPSRPVGSDTSLLNPPVLKKDDPQFALEAEPQSARGTHSGTHMGVAVSTLHVCCRCCCYTCPCR